MSEAQNPKSETEVEENPSAVSSGVANSAITTTASQPSALTNDTAADLPRIKQEDGMAIGADAEDDSEAETLIQSPEKKRDAAANPSTLKNSDLDGDSTNVVSGEGHSRKRKRSVDERGNYRGSASPSRRSSPLSSPLAHPEPVDLDSDASTTRKRLRKSEEKKAKRSTAREPADSSDEKADAGKTRKRRQSDAVHIHKRDQKSTDSNERRETRSATYPRQSDDERSPSPPPSSKREHRRGISMHSVPHEFERKKRGRPPLINTRRHQSVERARSPDSEASQSPAPTRSATHKLVGQDSENMSPAAKTGPRKRRDKNGRTFLARAANNNNLEDARIKFVERPEDLNLADNAGNTPLQIAALEGHVEIVEFLLKQKCEIDTKNIDKDTPLIDAVENGHVEVVKLLLDHGANPHLGNAKGDEPYELVPQEDENYEEIRKMLGEAKERYRDRFRTPGDPDKDIDGDSSRAASAASPRDSPPPGPRSPPTLASRRRTGRSESTRNDLLWQANTQENLTKLAGKGDVQGVASILNILQKAETESLIAAAKAGHEEVLQYLLGMGDPELDPDPVRSLKPGYNTPMLAAIGRGHVDVVKLLANQTGFNPTKKWRDRTYYELAEERKGQDWQQEREVLKAAYERYAASRGRKGVSPRKTRDMDKSKNRVLRKSVSPSASKRLSASPTITHKNLSTKSMESSPNDRRKAESGERRTAAASKPGFGESSTAISSDQDLNTVAPKKGHRVRRSQSDLPPLKDLDSESYIRRRRLISGKEHRRNRSTAPDNDSSDAESVDVIEVKSGSRTTPNLKRNRSSLSPDRRDGEGNRARAASKKRRTVLESSPEETRTLKRSPSPIDTAPDIPNEAPEHDPMTGIEETNAQAVQGATGVNGDAGAGETASYPQPDDELTDTGEQGDGPDISTKADSNETKLEGNPSPGDQTQNETPLNKAVPSIESDVNNELELESEGSPSTFVDSVAQQDADAAATEEAQRLEEEARQAAERRAREQAQAEAEAEAKRKAEEAAAAAQRAEEERLEQIRIEEENRRRQELLEAERRRREALPVMLGLCAKMIDENNPLARDPDWLSKFLPLFTVSTSQLEPNSVETVLEDRWAPNFQIACLLATKDLSLGNYASMDRRAANEHHKVCLWRVSRNMLSFEYDSAGLNTSSKQAFQREAEQRPKFLAMKDVFWVKLSDFRDQGWNQSHLRHVPLREQPISLRAYSDFTRIQDSPIYLNGAVSPANKLSNGIHPHSPSTDGISLGAPG